MVNFFLFFFKFICLDKEDFDKLKESKKNEIKSSTYVALHNVIDESPYIIFLFFNIFLKEMMNQAQEAYNFVSKEQISAEIIQNTKH